MLNVIFVGTDSYGLGAHGKCEPADFWPKFCAILEDFGCVVRMFERSSAFLSDNSRYGDAVIVPVFNESCIGTARSAQEIQAIIQHGQSCASRSLVCNLLESGLVMGDKFRANTELTAAGVPMPALIMENTQGNTIFSNARIDSGAAVQLTDMIDPDRYNSAFIDTRQHFRGKDYYVSLRAMCIGATMYSLVVRARDAAEGNPSVHASNTPRDPELLNYLYGTVGMPRMAEIADLCRKVEQRLGFGFYSHDILPENCSASVYLCETGFKFDEYSIRNFLFGLNNALIANDFMSTKVTQAAALVFIHEARTRLSAVQ